MRSVTFLHTADLHLGAPVRGLGALAPEWEERLVKSIPEAFDRVVAAALSHRVDFVVIAGDSFDTSRASYGDTLRYFEALSKLGEANIPTYLVTGNHDPYTSWAGLADRLPASAHLLGVGKPSFALFERDGEPLVLIGGRSYYNQTWPADADIAEGITRRAAEAALSKLDPRAASAPFSVGIIHTGLDLDQKKAPTDEARLLQAGIDYWACGHLHKRLVRPSEEAPVVAFPGCIQGRDIKETGERGCYLVKLEEGAPAALEFVPTASVALQSVEVDVSACRTLADIRRLVEADLFRANGQTQCEEMVVRVTLSGATDLHGFLSQRDVLRDLRKQINDAYPLFFCDALVDRTRPTRDLPTLARESLFPAFLMEVADDQREHDEQMINFVQSEFVKRGIAVPGSLTRRIREFGDAAEMLALDLVTAELEDAEGALGDAEGVLGDAEGAFGDARAADVRTADVRTAAPDAGSALSEGGPR